MENNLYLKEVTLSGYKSINNVNIEFQKGLNIIIGKNAAGKTNFLEFLNKILSLKYDDLSNFSSNLIFKNEKEISFKTQKNIKIEFDKINNLPYKVDSTLTIDEKKFESNEQTSLFKELRKKGIDYYNTFLCHGIPKEYPIIDKPLTFRIENKYGLSSDLANLFLEPSTPYFIKCLTIDIASKLIDIEEVFNIENIRKSFQSVFENTIEIRDILNQYSPIEDFRFSENFNVFITDDKEGFTLNNLFIEFKIDSNWLPFSNLSDGTKRLFYILSEVYENDSNVNKRPIDEEFYFEESKSSRIILIEEPELGIHPHQFHKLMGFLKEESQRKQIIITTHSPQALDSIDNNEFNRIIIAYTANYKEGTKLRHLNEEELIKANAYIQEEFLSDYWLYSDLEK